MEKNSTLTLVSVLVLGLVLGYLFAPRGYQNMGTHMMPNGAMMASNIDQHFIVQMIPHHEGAILMAKVALERSKRQEIISLANGIIEAQERENRGMRSWYESWFGSAPPTGGTGMMHMGGMEGDLSALSSVSAAEFDREFMEQMIPHHEMAIMMAQMLQSGTQRDEMKELADNIITSQTREINMMRSWLKSWYNQ